MTHLVKFSRPIPRSTRPSTPASTALTKPIQGIVVVKPNRPKPPIDRAAQREHIAQQIVGILRYRVRSASKVSLFCAFKGTFKASAIASAIRAAVQRGEVVKDSSTKPAKYRACLHSPFNGGTGRRN